MPFGWIIAGVFAWMFASSGGSKKAARPKVTTGTAMLIEGKAYRVEIEVSGPAVNANPQLIAYNIQASLLGAGAYNVLVQPRIPLLVTYSIVAAGTTPVVLNVAAQQAIGAVSADYTFRSVQEIALPKPKKQQPTKLAA